MSHNRYDYTVAPEDLEESSTPHSREDEHYAIGVSLFAERAALEIASRLEPDDFYLPHPRKCFDAIRSLTDRGEGVTSHNLYQEMRRQTPEEETDNPFAVMSPFEIEGFFNREEYRDVRGISATIARLKELRAYRELLTSAKAILIGASSRKPIDELINIYEETGSKILRSKGLSVVSPEQAGRGLSSLYDDLAEGRLQTLAPGYPELARKLWGGGFWNGDNVILAGETSTGKTTFALNLVTNAALEGKRVLYFSREMSYRLLLLRIHSRLAKVPAWKIKPNMDAYGEGIRERLRRTQDLVSCLPIFWDDKTADITSARRVTKDYKRNEGIDLVVFDYLKLFRPPSGTKGGTADRVSAVSREIKETATDNDIPALDISQLSRAKEGEQGGEPSLERLKDSGDVENDADTVLMLWRSKREQGEGEKGQLLESYCKIAKQRNGLLDRFKLFFAPDIYSFTSAEQLKDAEARLEEARL
jgi:replicative DNA helicase